MHRWLALVLLIPGCVAPPPREPLAECSPAAGQSPQPRRISATEPDYPERAQRFGISGWVELSGSIGASGEIVDPTVLRAWPPGSFEGPALEAFRQWRYCPPDPGVEHSEPVTVRIRFKAEPVTHYYDEESGIAFLLPPGWSFQPLEVAEQVAAALAPRGSEVTTHFAARRDGGIPGAVPDSLVVLTAPATDTRNIAEVCTALRGREAKDLRAAPTGLHLLGGQAFCSAGPNELTGYAGRLYVGVGRGRLVFVAAFEATPTVEGALDDALTRLRFDF